MPSAFPAPPLFSEPTHSPEPGLTSGTLWKETDVPKKAAEGRVEATPKIHMSPACTCPPQGSLCGPDLHSSAHTPTLATSQTQRRLPLSLPAWLQAPGARPGSGIQGCGVDSCIPHCTCCLMKGPKHRQTQHSGQDARMGADTPHKEEEDPWWGLIASARQKPGPVSGPKA